MGLWTMAGRRASAALIAGLALCAAGAPARGDEQLDKANALYAGIQKDRRSDLVILPALHEMDAAPKEPGEFLAAFLMTPNNPAWETASGWAKGEKQQAVITALKKVTDEADWRKAWAFGQPYGAGALDDPKFVDWKLYTELGEDNTLASAQFLYLGAIRKMEILCHVEATRLLAEGKGNDAMDLMRRWAWFSYQIASRQMLKEKVAGLDMLSLAFARMRDLAYTDMMASAHSMTATALSDTIAKLGERNPINIDKLELPLAEKLAAQQLVARTFTPGGGPDPEAFARVYARVASGDRALRRFSEAAKWDTILKLHANTDDTMKLIGEVYGDWDKRWSLSQWDAFQELATDYVRLDKVRFAALDLVMGDVGQVFPRRRELWAEWVGTRASLGAYGYFLQQSALAVKLNSVVPVFVGKASLMNDPFDKNVKDDRGMQMAYVRSGIDNVPTGAAPKPILIRVFPRVAGVEYPNFEAKVMPGFFMIYSAGPDGNHNGCSRATQMVRDEHGDYLIWPPVLSLARQYLIDQGRTP